MIDISVESLNNEIDAEVFGDSTVDAQIDFDSIIFIDCEVDVKDLRVDSDVSDLLSDIEIELKDVIFSGGGGGSLPKYKGPYSVTPRVKEIILKTKNKEMTDDVTVFQIPYQETQNPSGGKTVVIGLE